METALILKVVIAIATLAVTVFGFYRAYWSPASLRKKKIKKMEDKLKEIADEQTYLLTQTPFDNVRYYYLTYERQQLLRDLAAARSDSN